MNRIISNDMMASYLQKALSSNTYKRVIASLDAKEVDYFFENYANIISKYYVSTLDDSLETADAICLSLFNYRGNNFFKDILMGLIVKGTTFDIKNYFDALREVDKNNYYNGFYTHAFPGALLPEVKAHGLDANKMVLKDEMRIINRYSKTPYKVGGLYYCEMSEGGFSYAIINMPESVHFALDIDLNEPLKEDEGLHEYYTRLYGKTLTKFKEEGTSKEELERLSKAGKAIIDFYGGTSKEGIAIFKLAPNSKLVYKEQRPNFKLLDVSKYFKYNSIIGKTITDLISDMEMHVDDAYDIWNRGMASLCGGNPNLQMTIEMILKENFAEQFMRFAIRNYKRSYADGYEVPGSKLSPEKFSTLEFEIPRVVHHQERKKGATLLRSNARYDNNLEERVKEISEIEKQLQNIASLDVNPENIYSVNAKSLGLNLILFTSRGKMQVSNHYPVPTTDGILISKLSTKALIHSIIKKQTREYLETHDNFDAILEKYNFSYDDTDSIEEQEAYAVTAYMKESFLNLDEDIRNEVINEEALLTDLIRIRIGANGAEVIAPNGTEIVPIKKLVSLSENCPYNGVYSTIIERNNKLERK